MFLFYLKTIFRNARSHKSMMAISLLGLVLSFSCSLLIFLHVQHEYSYDRFYPDQERIFRIAKSFVNDDGELVPDAFTPGALAPALNSFSQIESITRIEPVAGKALVTTQDKSLYENNLLGVDPSFFDVFNLSFLEGRSDNSLNDNKTVVITRSMRQKFFGDEVAIGRTIKIDILGDERIVSGVVEDMPVNSHFHFTILFKLITKPFHGYSVDQEWNGYNWYTYVKFLPDQKINLIAEEVQRLIDKNSPQIKANYFFQPIADIHLHSQLKSELESNGSFVFIKILIITGLFILAVGLINFINLSVLKALYRSKEAGIKKINGASYKRLFSSYFLESMMLIVFAWLVSFALVNVALTSINNLFGSSISFHNLNVSMILTTAAALGALCIISAVIPSIYYANFNPMKVLKGKLIQGSRFYRLRKALIIFQFSVATVLLIFIIVIQRQMQFVRSSELGFDHEQLLVLSGVENGDEIRNKILELPEVIKASFAGSLPGEKNAFFNASPKGSSKTTIIEYSFVDYDYFEALKIEILEGRNFSRDFPSDASSFPLIVNETAVRVLGLGNNAVGSEITPNSKEAQPIYFKIIGVVKDFNFATFHEEIKPYLFTFSPTNTNLVLKLKSDDYHSTLGKIQSIWKSSNKLKPIDFHFLDDSFYSKYKAEEKFQTFLLWLTGITIFIACSGLLSVANFLMSSRKKELGIRKVMGADSTIIFNHLCIEYLQLAIISIVISIPFSLFIANEWLGNFVYKVTISGVEFILAAGAIIIFTLLTVFYQSFKMSSASPIAALRTE